MKWINESLNIENTKRGTGVAGSSSCVSGHMVNYWKIDIRMEFVIVNPKTYVLYMIFREKAPKNTQIFV